MRSTDLDALADSPWAYRGPQQDGPVSQAAVAVPEAVQGFTPADGLCGIHTEPGGGQRRHGGQLVARQLEAGKPSQVLLDADLVIKQILMRRWMLQLQLHEHEMVQSMTVGNDPVQSMTVGNDPGGMYICTVSMDQRTAAPTSSRSPAARTLPPSPPPSEWLLPRATLPDSAIKHPAHTMPGSESPARLLRVTQRQLHIHCEPQS